MDTSNRSWRDGSSPHGGRVRAKNLRGFAYGDLLRHGAGGYHIVRNAEECAMFSLGRARQRTSFIRGADS